MEQDRTGRRNTRRGVPGNSWRTLDTSPGRFQIRGTVVVVVVVVVALVLMARLVQVQLLQQDGLAHSASEQRTVQTPLYAERGAVTDRDGRDLAYTMKASMIVAFPNQLETYMADRYRIDKRTEENPDGALPPDEQLDEIVDEVQRIVARGAGQLVLAQHHLLLPCVELVNRLR